MNRDKRPTAETRTPETARQKRGRVTTDDLERDRRARGTQRDSGLDEVGEAARLLSIAMLDNPIHVAVLEGAGEPERLRLERMFAAMFAGHPGEGLDLLDPFPLAEPTKSFHSPISSISS